MSETNRHLLKFSYFGIWLLLISIGMTSPSFSRTAIGGASLNGIIADPSGAAVPNTKVSVTNTATGLTRTTQANEVGLYGLGGLPARAPRNTAVRTLRVVPEQLVRIE